MKTRRKGKKTEGKIKEGRKEENERMNEGKKGKKKRKKHSCLYIVWDSSTKYESVFRRYNLLNSQQVGVVSEKAPCSLL